MTTWKAERGLSYHCPSGDPSLKFFFFFWPEDSRIGIDILAVSSRPLLHSVFSSSYTSALLLFGSREPNSLLWTIITDVLHQEREIKMGKGGREGLWDPGFLSHRDLPAHSGLSSLKLMAKS